VCAWSCGPDASRTRIEFLALAFRWFGLFGSSNSSVWHADCLASKQSKQSAARACRASRRVPARPLGGRACRRLCAWARVSARVPLRVLTNAMRRVAARQMPARHISVVLRAFRSAPARAPTKGTRRDARPPRAGTTEVVGFFEDSPLDSPRAHSACYISDWTDGFTAHVHILAPSTYIFFASVIPALTFGEQLADLTDGQINGVHVLIATAMCGTIQSVLGGQPLLIVGVAEPIGTNVLVLASNALEPSSRLPKPLLRLQ